MISQRLQLASEVILMLLLDVKNEPGEKKKKKATTKKSIFSIRKLYCLNNYVENP